MYINGIYQPFSLHFKHRFINSTGSVGFQTYTATTRPPFYFPSSSFTGIESYFKNCKHSQHKVIIHANTMYASLKCTHQSDGYLYSARN